MEAMDFVEKRSSYLEKASHFIEKKRFVVQNAGVQPLLWNFNGDIIVSSAKVQVLRHKTRDSSASGLHHPEITCSGSR